MIRKIAWAFLAAGVASLAGYLYLLFHYTGTSAGLVVTLLLSIVFNVIAVNLFYLSHSKRRRKKND